MATIRNFLYCVAAKTENIKEGESQKIVIDGLLNALTPDFIPGNYSFSIVFSVLNLNDSDEHTVRLSFTDEEKEMLLETEETKLKGGLENKNNIPNEFLGYNVCVDMRNVLFKHEGLYSTKVFVDGEEEGEYTIYVKGKEVQ